MKQLIYKSTQVLSCKCDTDVIVCVSTSLTVSGAPFVDAVLTQTIPTSVSVCHEQIYAYYLEYDEAQLVDPFRGLLAVDVVGILCKGCLVSYIDWKSEQGGPVGPVGPQGAVGPAGPAGIQGPAGPAGPTGVSCTDIGVWQTWNATVGAVSGGSPGSIVKNLRFSVTPNGKYVTVAGNVGFHMSGSLATGIRLTLPVAPNMTYYSGSGCHIKVGSAGIYGGTLKLYTDLGTDYIGVFIDDAVNFVHGEDYIIMLSFVYEGL